MSLNDLIARFTSGPADLLHFENRGNLKPGSLGDVTIFDPNAQWVFRPEECASLSRNNPFNNWPLTGRPTHTIVGGRVIHQL